jgi:hypothetical protein
MRMLGRNDALLAVQTKLVEQKFVTIVGPGGIGKTTLAVAVAHEMSATFDGHVHFVDLAALGGAELVAPAVATALGVSRRSTTDRPRAGRARRLRTGRCGRADCRGNSLIGVADLSALAKGIPDAAYTVMDEDDKAVASYYRALNRSQRDGNSKDKQQSIFEFAGAPKEITDAARALDEMPENDVDQVRAKAAAFEALHATEGWIHLKAACDLFVATFFMNNVGEVPRTPADEIIPTTDHVWLSMRGTNVRDQILSNAVAASASVNAFHWPLMFPEVFGRGGFDAVIGKSAVGHHEPRRKGILCTV